jgi:hypothetical protein
VESRRAHGEKVEMERRSSLGSLPAEGGRCSAAVRPQWGGENKWQWGLEVSCAAEASRMGSGLSPTRLDSVSQMRLP